MNKSSKPKIAVVGVGIMGHGIADNFLQHGYEVALWNRTPGKLDDLAAKGAELGTTPADTARQADIVFEVTANDESSRSVWLGDNGILAGAKPDTVCITSATLSVKWVDELAQTCAARALTFFDMPMTGGRVGAETGQLTLLVGGDEARLSEVRADLGAIAKDVKYFGKAGSGIRYKLILNTLQAIHLAGFGEALRLAEAAGLDQKLVGDALAERPGGVTTQIGLASYRHQPHPITFSVDWITKDLGYAAKMGAGQPHPLLDDVLGIYKIAVAKGKGNGDWTVINE